MGSAAKFATMVDVYRHATTQYGHRPLFGTKGPGGWEWMGYGEFRAKTDAVRGGLASLGVGAGDRVAAIMNNRPEWAMGAYASYGLGAAWVPMYEEQKDREWEYILRDCGAKVVIVSNTLIRDRIVGIKGSLPDLAHVVFVDGAADSESTAFSTVIEKGKAAPVDLASPEPGDIAGFIYTSGTTGNPKGVKLSHGNFATNVAAIHEIFPVNTNDRSLCFLPWAHSFGQTVELHLLFSLGGSLALAESIPKIVDNLAEVQPTVLLSVPRIFNKIYDAVQKKLAAGGRVPRTLFEAALATADQKKKLAREGRASGFLDLKHRVLDRLVFSKVRARFGGRLRFAISGGAAISRQVAEFIDNLGIPVYEGYGLTETSPIVATNYPGNRKIGSIGKAIPGVTVTIDRAATEDPVQGEIVVHGPNVMLGYHNLPEENGEVLTEDGGLRTGDMGYVDDDGFIFITGRIKEQYKLENGKYVVPSPLQELLKLSPFIVSAMIYGDNRPHNVALVVPDMESLKKWAGERDLPATDLKQLFTHPKVRDLYHRQLEEYSAEFKSFEKVREFALLEEDFSMDNGMLTPSLKLKRRVVMERYSDVIDALYGK